MSATDDLQASIDRTRADLAATLNELEDKLNLPKQAGVQLHRARVAFDRDPKPWLIAAGSAVVGGIVLLALRRR